MDRDDGNIIYEIEFYAGSTEYDYEINALSGEIIKSERDQENDHYYSSGSSNNSSSSSNTSQSTSSITADQAKQIALNHASLSADQISGYEVERDSENGIVVYEIDFRSGNYEYEYEINGTTGAIIKSKKDIDD